jgi:hypothetical protein
MLTENGSQNLVSAAHDSTRKLRGPMHREDERTALIAEVKFDSASYPLSDAVGICCLPTPSPHLGPRRRWLLGHGSLPGLRLRVEHLDLFPREMRISTGTEIPEQKREKERSFQRGRKTVLAAGCGWYLVRRHGAQVRLLHASGAGERRREETRELDGVPVLQKNTNTLGE